MFNKATFPGKYIQGRGASAALPGLVKQYGSKALLLAGPSVMKQLAEPAFGHDGTFFTEVFSGECSRNEIDRLVKLVQHDKLDVVAGMGGGKVIDTAKAVADDLSLPVIIVPTIASSDAPCSGVAVIYTEEGVFESVRYQKNNPTAVLVDMDIIAKSPPRLLAAGMGDALSTWFEARSCERTQSPNECGGISTMAGLHLSKLCFDTIIEYGEAALISCQQKIVSQALEKVTEANILLSGIGFESSGLAAAHAIHNGLTALPETHAFYHGEKVAFGVLTGLWLTGAPMQEIEQVYAFCKSVGLPTCLKDIGINNLEHDKLKLVAAKSCEAGQSIHHEAGTITAEMVLHAMLLADAFGNH